MRTRSNFNRGQTVINIIDTLLLIFFPNKRAFDTCIESFSPISPSFQIMDKHFTTFLIFSRMRSKFIHFFTTIHKFTYSLYYITNLYIFLLILFCYHYLFLFVVSLKVYLVLPTISLRVLFYRKKY